MGGDRRFYYPKYVWSPAGGWWNHTPKNWARNRTIAFFAVAAMAIPVCKYSSGNERRPIPPRFPIMSQLWCAHAGVDDPMRAPVDN